MAATVPPPARAVPRGAQERAVLAATGGRLPDLVAALDEAPDAAAAALGAAVLGCQLKAAKVALLRGADPAHLVPGASVAPIHVAAAQGDAALVEALLASSAPAAEARCAVGRTALMYAAMCGHARAAHALLACAQTQPAAVDALGFGAAEYARRWERANAEHLVERERWERAVRARASQYDAGSAELPDPTVGALLQPYAHFPYLQAHKQPPRVEETVGARGAREAAEYAREAAEAAARARADEAEAAAEAAAAAAAPRPPSVEGAGGEAGEGEEPADAPAPAPAASAPAGAPRVSGVGWEGAESGAESGVLLVTTAAYARRTADVRWPAGSGYLHARPVAEGSVLGAEASRLSALSGATASTHGTHGTHGYGSAESAARAAAAAAGRAAPRTVLVPPAKGAAAGPRSPGAKGSPSGPRSPAKGSPGRRARAGPGGAHGFGGGSQRPPSSEGGLSARASAFAAASVLALRADPRGGRPLPLEQKPSVLVSPLPAAPPPPIDGSLELRMRQLERAGRQREATDLLEAAIRAHREQRLLNAAAQMSRMGLTPTTPAMARAAQKGGVPEAGKRGARGWTTVAKARPPPDPLSNATARVAGMSAIAPRHSGSAPQLEYGALPAALPARARSSWHYDYDGPHDTRERTALGLAAASPPSMLRPGVTPADVAIVRTATNPPLPRDVARAGALLALRDGRREALMRDERLRADFEAARAGALAQQQRQQQQQQQQQAAAPAAAAPPADAPPADAAEAEPLSPLGSGSMALLAGLAELGKPDPYGYGLPSPTGDARNWVANLVGVRAQLPRDASLTSEKARLSEVLERAARERPYRDPAAVAAPAAAPPPPPKGRKK